MIWPRRHKVKRRGIEHPSAHRKSSIPQVEDSPFWISINGLAGVYSRGGYLVMDGLCENE
jgi:hypothetical protein